MKTAYLVRYGAFGDMINFSAVLPALRELGYRVTVETNWKGVQILSENPHIAELIGFEPWQRCKTAKEVNEWVQRLDDTARRVDLYVNFSQSLEGALIEPETKPSYLWPLWLRREKNAQTNYYDQTMRWCGLTAQKYMGRRGEIWFSCDEHRHVLRQLAPYKDRHVTVWALRGSMHQKAVAPLAPKIVNAWLDRHPEAAVITTGDEFCHQFEWDYPNGETIRPDAGLGDGTARLIHKSGRWPFRQAVNTARYANLVVTPETGLGIAAGAMGVPKIMMLTAASLKNIVGNDIHDYSVQSDAWCSPCTRAIYNTDHCDVDAETGLPICVNFSADTILERMEQAYGVRDLPQRHEAPGAGPAYM